MPKIWKNVYVLVLLTRLDKTLEVFLGLRWNFSEINDSDDESDDSKTDADEATIWERGERTRRCAISLSYIGVSDDSIGDRTLDGVETADEALEVVDSVIVGAMDGFFGATSSVIGDVAGIDAGFELIYVLDGGVGADDGGFEPGDILTGGAGAIDGFLVAINSETGRAGPLRSYRNKFIKLFEFNILQILIFNAVFEIKKNLKLNLTGTTGFSVDVSLDVDVRDSVELEEDRLPVVKGIGLLLSVSFLSADDRMGDITGRSISRIDINKISKKNNLYQSFVMMLLL